MQHVTSGDMSGYCRSMCQTSRASTVILCIRHLPELSTTACLSLALVAATVLRLDCLLAAPGTGANFASLRAFAASFASAAAVAILSTS